MGRGSDAGRQVMWRQRRERLAGWSGTVAEVLPPKSDRLNSAATVSRWSSAVCSTVRARRVLVPVLPRHALLPLVRFDPPYAKLATVWSTPSPASGQALEIHRAVHVFEDRACRLRPRNIFRMGLEQSAQADLS